MNITGIIVQLKSERDRLDQAIVALSGAAGRRGRAASSDGIPARRERRGRRHMSAAGRASLRRAMKKRWAAAKKVGKTRL